MWPHNFFSKLFHTKKQSHQRESFDYENLLNSMFNNENIYKSLAKISHPDLYPEELKEEANALFKELQKERHNIDGMNKLRSQIEALYRKRNFSKD